MGADLGVALDGDGDRSIMVDHEGNVVDGDEMLFVLLVMPPPKYRIRRRCRDKMSNLVGTALAKLEVPFARTAVGDRFVLREMQRGWQLGGESSGHIIGRDITTTGDGIVSALQALTAVALTDKPLWNAAQCRSFHNHDQRQVGQNHNVSASQSVRDAVSGVEANCRAEVAYCCAPSGTEPVLRVMVEGEDADLVAQLARELAGVVAEAEEFA